MTKSNENKDQVIFVDEEEYRDLQEKHPPESLAEINSAVNPETGEINWDCPCLGGMAQPPCGSFFKEAFTCFINSTSEPKGIDCVDNFRNFQDCLKQFPDIYADQLKEDEEKEGEKDESEGIEESTTKPTDSDFTTSSNESAPLVTVDEKFTTEDEKVEN